jgi:Family of unknown function (DUF5683)
MNKRIFISLLLMMVSLVIYQEAAAQYVGPLKKERRPKTKKTAVVTPPEQVNPTVTPSKEPTTKTENPGPKARPANTITDTGKKSGIKPHNPRLATIRSALIPGWGQAYNRKYWKIPIVYGALGTTTYIFFNNIKTYRSLRFAYQALVSNDAALIEQIDPSLPKALLSFPNSVRQYRDEFRRNIDYSVLFFILFWGLNVVDATVDGHLKNFDISPDISLKIKPGYDPLTRTNGLSIIFDIHKGKPKLLTVPGK